MTITVTRPTNDVGAVSVNRRARDRRNLFADALHIAPAGLLYTFLLVGPTVVALSMSFFAWNGVGAPHWVGLQNWVDLLHDSQVIKSLFLTLKVTAISWLLLTVLAMAAGLTTAGSSRAHSALAVLYVLPMLVSTAGLGLIWQALLAPQLGGLGYIGTKLHLGFLSANWLGDPSLVVYVITVIIVWQFTPFYTLLYRVARQQIPVSLYEAATLDGATGARAFLHVTLPQLRNTIATSSLLMVIGTFSYFDLFFLLTGGGPGNASRVLSLYVYNQGFSSTKFGYASALTILLVVFSIGTGAVLLWATRFSSESRRGGE